MIKLKLKYREINRRKINDISMLRIHTKVEDYEDCCLKERREQILNIDILRQNRKNNDVFYICLLANINKLRDKIIKFIITLNDSNCFQCLKSYIRSIASDVEISRIRSDFFATDYTA